MLDLVILLGLAMAVTALLGLLLAGFVWMPWLIGLFLLGLFVLLMRVSTSLDPSLTLTLTSEAQPESAESTSSLTDITTDIIAAHPPTQPAPTMLYRGAKYRLSDRLQSASSAVLKGKYRGNPWTHS